MPDNREAINLLKILRRQKRITIVELAEKMGVPQVWFVKVERGEIEATMEQIETIRAFIEERL